MSVTQIFEAGFSVETLFLLVLIAAPLACFLLWCVFGRDRPIVETVEFYPPEDLTPAEAGLFIDGKTHDREILSMLLFWADKGVISIEETYDDILIKRKGVLPGDAKKFEEILYRVLFLEADTVSARFFDDEIRIALDDAKSSLLKEYGSECIKSLYDLRSLEIRVLAFVITLLPMVFNLIYIYSRKGLMAFEGVFSLLAMNDLIVLPVIMILFSLIRFAGHFAKQSLSGNASSLTFTRAIVFSPLFIIGIVIFIPLAAPFFETPVHAVFVVISTILCAISAVNMPKRTFFYTRVLGKVRGFANFIKVAELDRMKMLINDDPGYYSKILPYAWAMGLSGTLGIRLDQIGIDATPPHWYSSKTMNKDFSYSGMTRSLNRVFDNREKK